MPSLPVIITCSIATYYGSRSHWDGACARARPCNTDKSDGRALARGMPHTRHLTRPSVPSPFSRSNQWPAGNHNGNPCLYCADLQEPPEVYSRRHHELPLFPMQFACALKGGLLSIATQELLLALQPSPLALTTASRPGIPVMVLRLTVERGVGMERQDLSYGEGVHT